MTRAYSWAHICAHTHTYSPNQSSLRVANKAKEHQQADEHVEQEQTQIAQPPETTNILLTLSQRSE